MKFILVYYSEFDGDNKDAAGNRALIDQNKLKAMLDANRPKGAGSMMVRSAEAFDGVVEKHGDQFPCGVVLIGDGPAIDRVGEAYKAHEIPIERSDLDDAGFEKDFTSGDDGDGDPFDGNIAALKARAIELSVNFSPTIGYNNLLARVMAAEKEAAAKASTKGE